MRNKTTAAILALFLGGLGIHRFYLKQTVLGIIYLIFCWTFIPSLIGFIDFIVFLSMSPERFDSKYNSSKQKKQDKEPSVIEDENDIISVSTKTANNKTEMSISFNEENVINLIKEKQKQRESEIRNYKYIPTIIQRQGIQLLESISILNTTKNIDTLIGRYEFIEKMYDDFVKASYNKRYISDIQVAIDQYKTMYYDKILKDFELTLLVEPNSDKLNNYYAECLFNCFDRFYETQIEEIQKLKREDAKSKRKEKISEIGNQTIFEFDKLNLDNDNLKPRLLQLKVKLNIEQPSKTIANSSSLHKVSNPIVINRNRPFELTLYNTSAEATRKVKAILKDDNIWNKSRELNPLFSEHNVKCKEVDEYILKYKPFYLNLIQDLKDSSQEYKEASEKDKEIIESEFKEKVLNKLPERAHCDLIALFEYSDIECSIDDRLVKKYGFEIISKYFGLSHRIGKIITNWERKDFEDLIKADLVYTADEIDQTEILTSQTLKTLNKICNKEEGFFKRKNKAIAYLQENQELFKNIGKYIATRNLFKLKQLPNEFAELNIEQIQQHWTFLDEYASLVADTYQSSERNYQELKEDNSWVKFYTIEKHEDYDPDCICLKAREHKKKYPKSNPPKLPFHVGCNCSLRTEF